MYLYEGLRNVRLISGSSVPIYAWGPGSAIAFLYLFGPEKYDGRGDLAAKFSAIKAGDEIAHSKEAERVCASISLANLLSLK